jgi:hypothetical protein
VVVLLLAGIVAASAAAQTTLGMHVGPSIATLGGEDSEGVPRTGFAVGVSATFGLAGKIGILVGGGYVQKGAVQTVEGALVTLALNYIEVPLLLRLGVPTASPLSPHFYLGPALSFESTCEAEVSSFDDITATVPCSEVALDSRSFDIGGMAGAGLDIRAPGPATITLDLFYNPGLSTIDDGSPADDLRNRAWCVVAGVGIGLG